MRRVTTSEVARELGLATTTIQKYAQAGRIPFDTTPGGHRRFDVDEVKLALELDRAPLTLTDLIGRRREIGAVARRHHLTNIRVVGSVARGEAGPGSDVDLLVDLGPQGSFVDVVDAADELEALLGVHVDLLTSGAVRGRLAHLADEAVPL